MEYPYVAKCKVAQGEYYVVFRAENEGIVVGATFQSDRIKLFEVGDFDESMFTPLEKDECVRISN